MYFEVLHERAVKLSDGYKKIEVELIDVLQKIDERKYFRNLGYSTFFQYMIEALKLSESQASAMSAICRKSQTVPELKQAIKNGEISLSKAKMMTAVLTQNNCRELIEKAKTLTQKQLEKEIAIISPKAVRPDKFSHLNGTHVEARMVLPNELMEEFKHVQDLESQRLSRACDYADTLKELVRFYREKRDPVIRAKRILEKKSNRKSRESLTLDQKEHEKVLTRHSAQNVASAQTVERVSRLSLANAAQNRNSSIVKHQMNLRDEGQCTFLGPNEERCKTKRWLQAHHKIPKHQGGVDLLENLTTLCQPHHKQQHFFEI